MIPKGFLFSSTTAGIKKGKQHDMGIIVSEFPCAAAGVFTKNRARAAPVLVSLEHLNSSRQHYAVVCNSGCANAATGRKGLQDAKYTSRLLAREIGSKPEEVLVASTGVIGQPLPMKKVEMAIPKLVKKTGEDSRGFARAIMTTDTKPKTAGRSVTVGRKKVTIWGVAKGAGMIHPDMATMLGFLVTDAVIPKTLLKRVLKEAVKGSFNCITVDGDTSTNDSVFFLANGTAGNLTIKSGTADFKRFSQAVKDVCASLAEQIVMDGEGATRIAEIRVEKAKSKREGEMVARAIAGSLLVKTALHGMDPNWGRIIAAAGYSGAKIDPDRAELYFGKHCAFRKGMPVKNMESKLAREMRKKKVALKLVLNRGKATASYLFCDLSRDYVTINADYRS